MVRYLLYSLFLLSGFSALVYEVSWSQYLKMILGHAAYAQALVLVVFMGGLSLGAWLIARRGARLKNPLLIYLLIEAALGIAALVFHPLYLLAEGAYRSAVHAVGPGPALLFVIKAFFSTVLILPQSVLLGATFPLISTVLVRKHPAQAGEILGSLYFNNSLGAALGALATGFLLIPLLGLPATLGTAGVINLLIAALIAPLVLSNLKAAGLKAVSPPLQPADGDAPWGRLLLWAAALTGLASFLYEIAWIRLLSLVLGSSTHAFELMLSAFILGLALGGLWIRKRADSLKQPLLFLAFVQIAMGIFAMLSFPMYSESFSGMEFFLRGLARTDQGYVLFQFLSHGLALFVMLPATFCAGATLPLLTRILISQGGGERSIGIVYASNTVGAIVGVLLAVFLLLPWLGLKATLVIGAAVDIGLGLFILWRSQWFAKRRFWLPATLGAGLLTVLMLAYPQDPLLLNSEVYRRMAPDFLAERGFKPLFYKDGRTATVLVAEKDGANRILKVNGKTDAGITPFEQAPAGDEPTQVLTGAIPLAIQPNMKRALVIGFGSGQTSATLLAHAGLERVDTVEIEAAVIEAGQYFRPTVDAVFDDPRSHIHIDDGRSFMARPGTPYDVIISEPSNPWVSGVAGLFTTEFYAQAVQRLAPDGVLVQWLQLYEMNFTLLGTVFNALAPHCADFAVYEASGRNILVVCSRQQRSLHPVAEDLFEQAELARILKRLDINTLADFAVRRVASGDVLGPMFRELTPLVNSDFDPLLGYQAPRYHFFGSGSGELSQLRATPFPLLTLLDPLFRHSPRDDLTWSEKSPRAQAIYDINLWLKTFHEADYAMTKPTEVNALRQLLENSNCATRGGFLADHLFNRVPSFDGAVDQDTVQRFWRRFDRFPCADQVPSEVREWVGFLKAMSRYEVAAMGEKAQLLLEQEGEIAQRYHSMLLGAAMTARLAGDQAEQAWALYQQHDPEGALSGEPAMLALLGMAKERMAQAAVQAR